MPLLLPVSGVKVKDASLLWWVLAASFVLFLLAHLFLFHLYNPGRYMQHTVPVVMSIAAGISLSLLLQRLFHWNSRAAILCGVAGIVILLVQFQKTYAYGYGYKTYLHGRHSGLYSFLSTQPKNILIGSLSREADSLPAFSARSILIGREYALPYHVRYYHQIFERGSRLLKAQYSADPADLRKLLSDFHIDYILLDRDAFSPNYFSTNPWINVFQPAAKEARAAVAARKHFAITGMLQQCTVFQDEDLILLKGECLAGKK